MVDIETTGERPRGPVAIAREAHKRVQQGGDHKIFEDIATVTIEDNPFGGFSIKIGFHESQMDRAPFVFRGARAKLNQFPEELQDRIVTIFNQPASRIQQISEDVGILADILEITYDFPQFEFVKLDAASIGGMGEATDFEFTYETGDINRDIEVDIDTAIEKATISKPMDTNRDIETLFGLGVN